MNKKSFPLLNEFCEEFKLHEDRDVLISLAE